MTPRQSVPCPKFPGRPTLSAESCVLRSVWNGNGYRKNRAAYPVCAACPLARLRRKQLEANGWTLDLDAIRARIARRIRAEKRARLVAFKEMPPID